MDRIGRRLHCFHDSIRRCHGIGESKKVHIFFMLTKDKSYLFKYY